MVFNIGKHMVTTYSCGHKAPVTLYGDAASQERKLKWCAESGLCPDCYAEQIKKDRASLIAIRKGEYDLPDLEGSEKQVKWAEKIRNAGIDLLESAISEGSNGIALLSPFDAEKRILERQNAIDRCCDMFSNVTDARFYIDNRDGMYSLRWLERVCKSYETMRDIGTPDLPEEFRREVTMIPQNPSHADVVEVVVGADYVRATYPRNESFRAVVKKLRFDWSGEHCAWMRKCSQFTGSAQERASELVNALLRAGFIVMCADDLVREKAESANFVPECRRWIKKSKNGGYVIRWDRDDKDFYKFAMALPGAKYSRDEGGVAVSAVHWREILDFAYIHDFKLSEKARAVADAAKDAEIPSQPSEPPVPVERDKLAEILQSSPNILEDLIDT